MALQQLSRSVDRVGYQLAIALEIREAQQRLAALPLAQILARPAQLELALRDVEAVGALEDDRELVGRGPGERFSEKQDAHAVPGAPADAAAQLMKLREAEAFGALDHHQRGIRHVDADLDHRGADEKLDLSGNEALHHRGLFRGRQAAMQQSDLQIRKLPAQSRVGFDRGLHTLLRVFAYRAHPSSLLSLPARGPDAREHLRTPGAGKRARR